MSEQELAIGLCAAAGVGVLVRLLMSYAASAVLWWLRR